MESEFLYRYISFESFVGMVQKNALTFVLPSVWDDPQEDFPFVRLINQKDSAVEMAFLIAIHNKTYAQSWSELAESDAMWRIYAYNNRAVRVKVAKERIKLLDNVCAIPVTYSDEPFSCETFDEETLLSSLAYKRTAFCHEREVRLISQYKYQDEQDAQRHVKAVFIQYKHPDRAKMLESIFPDMEMEDQIDCLVNLLNIGADCKKTKDVSFLHIPDFISGVMVHPMAPGWYVDVVQEYCKRNNIPFEGQSELYRTVE